MPKSLIYLLVSVALMPIAAVHAAMDLGDVRLPPGFSIEVYAKVPNARSLALGNDGVVFVSNRRKDSVYAVVPGAENRVIEIADDLNMPNGIAWHEGDLYVAEKSRVLVYRDIDRRLDNPPRPHVLDIDLPSESHHGWRYIGFGPDAKLYISIGAPCNVCDKPGYARIDRMNPDGSDREIFADGIRNSVGFTWHPETRDLWFTDNGRDMMGDDIPPCELNRASEPGMHFGFPYCHGRDIADPRFGAGKRCASFTPPAQALGPHVAPLGVKFYTGEQFPEEYRGQIFIAEHGSWNRSRKTGYRLSLVRLENGAAVAYETFADGWLQGQSSRGRPVDLVITEDGSMLVSDDANGLVYRIYYEASE